MMMRIMMTVFRILRCWDQMIPTVWFEISAQAYRLTNVYELFSYLYILHIFYILTEIICERSAEAFQLTVFYECAEYFCSWKGMLNSYSTFLFTAHLVCTTNATLAPPPKHEKIWCIFLLHHTFDIGFGNQLLKSNFWGYHCEFLDW